MNLDEEIFLSPYLDGELAPEQRQRVDAALLSDTQFAEHLRELTAVRDTVTGLSRPACPNDLSAAVLARIQSPKSPVRNVRRAFGRDGLFSRPAGRAAVLLATAASFLVIASATFIAGALYRPGPLGVGPLASRPRPTSPVLSPTTVAVSPAPVVGPTDLAAREHLPDSDRLAPDARDRERDSESQKVRRLLDSPNLRRVFIVTDVNAGHAAQTVDDILASTPRKYATYICLSVEAGVGIDPERPGAASVYAVVVNEQEQDRLAQKLKGQFPRIAEISPKPESLTLLADVGQFRVLPGTPVADVIQPEGPARALRDDPTRTSPLIAELFVPPTRHGKRSNATGAARDGSADKAPRSPAPRPAPGELVRKDDRPDASTYNVVLVWVASPA